MAALATGRESSLILDAIKWATLRDADVPDENHRTVTMRFCASSALAALPRPVAHV